MNRAQKLLTKIKNSLTESFDMPSGGAYTITEDSQKGRVGMIVDLDFAGIIPKKDELKKVFAKHKEVFLKAMDKEFKALGFDKNEE